MLALSRWLFDFIGVCSDWFGSRGGWFLCRGKFIISGFGLNLLLGRLDFRMSCDLARVSSDGSVWE